MYVVFPYLNSVDPEMQRTGREAWRSTIVYSMLVIFDSVPDAVSPMQRTSIGVVMEHQDVVIVCSKLENNFRV